MSNRCRCASARASLLSDGGRTHPKENRALRRTGRHDNDSSPKRSLCASVIEPSSVADIVRTTTEIVGSAGPLANADFRAATRQSLRAKPSEIHERASPGQSHGPK